MRAKTAMRTQPWALCAVLCLLGPSTAQIARPKRGPEAKPKPRVGRKVDRASIGPSSFVTYSEQTSRALFRACDRDGDDRLTLREARRALQDMDRTRFARIDKNGDGRIQFDEFDKSFKDTAAHGGELVLTEWARKRLPASFARKYDVPPVLRRWFANLDRDDNDRLDRNEWKQVVAQLEQEPTARFVRLDRNLDGSLTVVELEPILKLITRLEARRPRNPNARRPLPRGFRVADLDANSLLDLSEIERALSRVHPTLVRLAERVLQSADSAPRDGYIDVFEIADTALSRQRNQGQKKARKQIEDALRALGGAESPKKTKPGKKSPGARK